MARDYCNYEMVTDEELIDRLRHGEEPVMDYICEVFGLILQVQNKFVPMNKYLFISN